MTLPLVRLPPLDLVRGFVAVGRRMSITEAARDLCVTQSAVSRQLAALEDFVGARLFVRGHRSISFTPEGGRLFEVADRAVTDLQAGFGDVVVPRSQRPVIITAPTGFAGLWLIPRIRRLQLRHPDVELRITSNNQTFELHSEGIDLAVRYGDRQSVPQQATPLLPETIAPAARPGLLKGPLRDPGVLADQVLLEFDHTSRRAHLGWDHWLHSRGWSSVRPRAVLRFNHYDQTIQAAMAGQGIVLGRPELIDLMLGDGSLELLTAPEPAPGAQCGHWLVQADAQPRRDVLDVIDWLREEAGVGLADA